MEWIKTNLASATTFIRNGLSINQLSTEKRGLPITRIETISNENIDPDKVGFANLAEEKYSDWLLMEGDILLSHINSEKHLGKVAIYEGYPNRLIHGMNLLCFRSNQKIINPKYLFYFLQQYRNRNLFIRISKRAVNQASMSISDLKKIKINAPPLREQRRIVEILDQADEIRKLRKQADEKAEKIIPALFYEMFGDPSNINKLDKLPLSEIIELNYGTGLPTRKRNPGEIPVYGSNGIVDYHNESLIDFRTIIIGRKGSAGMLHLTAQPCWPIDTTFYVKLKKKQVNLIYLYLALKELRLERLAIITGVPGINRDTILSQEIFLPDNGIQDKIESYYNHLEKIKFDNSLSKDKIEQLFSTLLSQAFDGSLTSSWREAHMRELLQEMEEQKKYLEKVN